MTLVDWPDELVRELADKRGLIQLGAGASRSCKAADGTRMPDWKGLLQELGASLTGPDKGVFDWFIESSRLLDAAELISHSISAQKRHQILIKVFDNPRIKPSDLYDCINLIDQPVVLTTNYDRLYENYWQELRAEDDSDINPLIVSDPSTKSIIDHMRAGRRLLVKVHGTITDVHNLVLSRSSYAKSRTEHAEFYRVVSALMLTRTMLFIGCGFNGDPDIDLLLEDAAFTAKSEYPHYAVLPRGRHESEKQALRNAYNIVVLEYTPSDDSHNELLTSLKDLADRVEQLRV